MINRQDELKAQSSGFVYFLLFLLSVVFILLKFNTLSLPYFWDEAWVYAPAIKQMSQHPGLLPSSLEDSFSRGHPLLYHFTGGLWVKLFGKSELALHTFAMTISFSFLFSLFYFGKKIVNPSFGLALVGAMMAQDLFFGQSALVLPEVFLAMASLWVYYFFVRKKWIAYAIAGALSVLVKEQAILLIGVLWFWSLTERIMYSGFSSVVKKDFVVKQLLMAVPLFILLVFLIIQKLQRGYYFFPTHIDMIKLEWGNAVFHLRLSLDILFGQTGRLFFTVLVILVFLFASKRIFFWKRLFIVILLFIVFKTGTGKWDLPLILTLVPMVFLFLFYMYQVHLKDKRAEEDPRGPLPVFVLVFIGFASINFFCNRYLLCLFPLIFFYFFYELHLHFKNEKKMFAGAAMLIIAVCAFKTYKKDGIGDDGPYYPNAVKVQQDLIKFCEDHKLGARKILVPYVMLSNLVNAEIGFRKTNEVYTNVSNTLDTTDLPEFVLFTDFEVSPEIESVLQSGKYTSVETYRHGKARGEVLVRK